MPNVTWAEEWAARNTAIQERLARREGPMPMPIIGTAEWISERPGDEYLRPVPDPEPKYSERWSYTPGPDGCSCETCTEVKESIAALPIEPPACAGCAEESVDVLSRARETVRGERQNEYGDPDQNLAAIGKTWAALLDLEDPLEAREVALMLAALKVVRAIRRDNPDDLIDAAGYILLAEDATRGTGF